MNQVPVEAVNDPTYRKYVLSCKTKFVTKNVSEEIKAGVVNQYQRHMVLLVPQESDQRTRFLSAWMPETMEEYFELVLDLGAPIHGPTRASIHMGHDQWCDRPYLTIMSKGVEEILLKFSEGITVQAVVLPANMDGEADQGADSSEGNYEVVS